MNKIRNNYRATLIVLLCCLSFLFIASCQDTKTNFNKLTVDELIILLGDNSWEKREQATQELIKRGKKNIPKLLNALKETKDAEVKWRLEMILDKFNVLILGKRLIPVLTDLANWKKNLEQQEKIVKKKVPNWRKTLQADLRKKFKAIRAKWLNEKNKKLQILLSEILQDISVIEGGLLPPKLGGTWTGPISQPNVVKGLERLYKKLRSKIDEFGDMDKDGMPTSWELQNGLNPQKDDSKEDPDKDGKTNLEEYKKGTDPQKK